MKKFFLLGILSLSLVGCGESEYTHDQTLRQELFFKCLGALPAGPLSTKYNDWDDVVNACGSQSYYQSMYCIKNCPPIRGKENETR